MAVMCCELLSNCIFEILNTAKSEANIKRKIETGVTQYNYYSFEYEGETFRLNVEVVDGVEFPHSINKIINAD